jgi:CubicO group peptidase (beta-lactamase class C family)
MWRWPYTHGTVSITWLTFAWLVNVRAIIVSVLVASSAMGQAPTTGSGLPGTPAGRLAAEWLQLCQAPDVARMTAWVKTRVSDAAATRMSPDDRAAGHFALCTANGGFHVAAVTRATPTVIQAQVVGARSGTWFAMVVEVDSAGKLERAGALPTTPSESAMPRDLRDSAVAIDVRRLVAQASAADLFSGIVIVARDTQIIARATAGYANIPRHTPITGSTQFTLGSMGKMFTAASIGQLVDRGMMSFNDRVGKFFPEYPNATVRDQVTVGMLLSHTAGLGDFLSRRTPEMMQTGVARAVEFMPLYDQDAPLFPPGSKWQYSNAGLALAGAIVEKVSGEDYPTYIRAHIFAPAGMTHSDPNNRPLVSPLLVTPYTKLTDQGPSPDWVEAPADIGSPAGGSISTADDLVRFAAALRGGRLVRPATFAEIAKPRQSTPTGDQYGYAMEILDVYGRTVVGHGGAFAGVSTHLYLVLGSPYIVVVLANQDPPADGYVGRMTLALVAEKAKTGQ